MSAHDAKRVSSHSKQMLLAREMGYTGVALRACKGLLMAAAALVRDDRMRTDGLDGNGLCTSG